MPINTDKTTVDSVAPATSKQPTETIKEESAPACKVGETTAEVEEIHTAETPTGKTKSKTSIPEKKEVPNPLLLDPYEYDQCNITIVYTRLGDRQASISVHNHKDDPLVKTFPLTEVPLPEQIACVIEKLLEIWPNCKVSATMVLLPQEDETERRMVVSIRTGNDTPVVLTGTASEFPLPPSIATLLDELKELLPARAMSKIQKEAKKKSKATAAKTTSPAAIKTALATNDGKTQMTLF